jgi:hypothetical protein
MMMMMNEVNFRFVGIQPDGFSIVEALTPIVPHCLEHVRASLVALGMKVVHADVSINGERVVQRLLIAPDPTSLVRISMASWSVRDACVESLRSLVARRGATGPNAWTRDT